MALLQLGEQRHRIVRRRDDHAEAGAQRLERTEDGRVTHGVRDRLDIELGELFVLPAARAARPGALRFGACAMNLDAGHASPCFGYLTLPHFITLNTVEKDVHPPIAPSGGSTPNSMPPPGRAHRSNPRERVFQALELHDAATIGDVAAATGLHENTVREHLARLHEEGRVRSRPAPAAGRGRPALLWSVVDLATSSATAGLAAALADSLARTENARELAFAAGLDWGARVAAGAPDDGSVHAGSTIVLDAMRAQGFDPVLVETAREAASDCTTVELRSCPIRAAAAAHPDIVCAVHAGLVEGLARSRRGAFTAELTPFAGPERCLLRIRPVS